MAERSEEERFRVGDEDVDEAQGGEDQPEGGHGEDRAVHPAGVSSHLLSFIQPVGSLCAVSPVGVSSQGGAQFGPPGPPGSGIKYSICLK